MARVSFTLRKSEAEQGSALRTDLVSVYDGSGAGGTAASIGPRTDSDSAFRAEGLLTPPNVLVEDPFFEARSTCYGEVDLTWGVSLSAEVPDSPDPPEAVAVLLVYSPTGPPQTVASGTILVESSSDTGYRHDGLREGRWVYYSLFVKYANSEEEYYERAASLDVLVPKNYGSNVMLWNRIPAYYQAQDQQLGSPVSREEAHCIGNVHAGDVVGPLFKYLSIVGFDIDYVRTMLDYIMVMRDPELANTQALDAISEQLGAEVLSGDLGATRLRNMLDNIGFHRRSKGTPDGIKFLLQAITGAEVDVDTDAHEITVYSQRVNYVKDPQIGHNPPDGPVFEWRVADASEVDDPDVFNDFIGPQDQSNFTWDDGVFTRTGGTNEYLMIQLATIPPAKPDGSDNIVFSVHSGAIQPGTIAWGRLVTHLDAPVSDLVAPIYVNGVPTLIMPATQNLTNVYRGYAVALKLDLLVRFPEVGSTFDFKLLLGERNYLGGYFDGDTRRGGWLIDSQSISDYRWVEKWGGNDFSVYTEDYERTKQVIAQVLEDVLPITEVSKYEIVEFDAVQGFALD